MKFYRAIVATIGFCLILGLVYYFHISYFHVDVIFYAAIADGIIAAILSGMLIFAARYFSIFGLYEKVQLVVIWLLCGYALAISLPTVIDRSLSFYILEKLQQRGGKIKQESFEQVFTQEYVKEYRLVDVRLTEQLESGTIDIQNGCVILTEKGGAIASFGKYFRGNWLPEKRLLMGEYTDVLTDPFRNSIQHPEYMCE